MWKKTIGRPRQEVLLREDGVRGGSRFFIKAVCACGVHRETRCTSAGLPYAVSCGCAQKESQARSHTTHGGSNTRLYRIYKGLFDRCYNPNDTGYANYGGRGIRVVKKWSTFEAFRDWSLANGYQDDLTLDRRNNDGPYSPSNCRWITEKEQHRNTSKNRMLTAWGETKCVVEWAEDFRCVVGKRTLETRIRMEWEPEDALTAPLHSRPYGRMTNGTYRVADTVKRVKGKP